MKAQIFLNYFSNRGKSLFFVFQLRTRKELSRFFLRGLLDTWIGNHIPSTCVASKKADCTTYTWYSSRDKYIHFPASHSRVLTLTTTHLYTWVGEETNSLFPNCSNLITPFHLSDISKNQTCMPGSTLTFILFFYVYESLPKRIYMTSNMCYQYKVLVQRYSFFLYRRILCKSLVSHPEITASIRSMYSQKLPFFNRVQSLFNKRNSMAFSSQRSYISQLDFMLLTVYVATWLNNIQYSPSSVLIVELLNQIGYFCIKYLSKSPRELD